MAFFRTRDTIVARRTADAPCCGSDAARRSRGYSCRPRRPALCQRARVSPSPSSMSGGVSRCAGISAAEYDNAPDSETITASLFGASAGCIAPGSLMRPRWRRSSAIGPVASRRSRSSTCRSKKAARPSAMFLSLYASPRQRRLRLHHRYLQTQEPLPCQSSKKARSVFGFQRSSDQNK
jgi:hypothetical protein